MHLMTSDPSARTMFLGVAFLVCGIVGVGTYIWYGLALSRLFPKLGSERLKGWIPFANDAEIFVLGGLPGWSVVLCFIPLVNIYALILRIRATSRINSVFGKGGGMTVLAILLPPLWATILASSRPLSVASRIVPTMAPPPVPVGTPSPAAVVRAAASESAAEPVATTCPSEPLGAAEVRLTPISPYLTPSSQSEVQAGGATVPQRPTVHAPDAGVEECDLADKDFAGMDFAGEDFADEDFAGEDSADDDIAGEDIAGEDIAGMDFADDDEDGGATIVVERPPASRWRLSVEGVGEFPLIGEHVLLGRKPSGTSEAQALKIPDTTRTVSKVHARVDLVNDGWVITDLNSTNGVIIVAADGTERLLAVGDTAAVPFSFILGKLEMSISFEGSSA